MTDVAIEITRQRLTLSLGATNAHSLEAAIEASDSLSASRKLLPVGHHQRRDGEPQLGQLAPNELVIFYTVDGVVAPGSSQSAEEEDGNNNLGGYQSRPTEPEAFLLDHTTRQRHATHLALRRDMRYVLCYYEEPSSSPGEGESPTRSTSLGIKTIAVPVSSASMQSGRSVTEVAARRSPWTEHANGVVDLVEKGIATADVDTALTHLCSWVLESIALIDAQWQRVLSGVDDAMRQGLSSGKDSELMHPGLSLQLIEGLTKRCAMFENVASVVTNPEGAFEKLKPHVEPSSIARQQLEQRVALLLSCAELARVEALTVSPLARPLLTLKLYKAGKQQELQSLFKELIQDRLAFLLVLVCRTLPDTDALEHERIVTSTFLQKVLLPTLCFDFVTVSEHLLSLSSIFEPRLPPSTTTTTTTSDAADNTNQQQLEELQKTYHPLVLEDAIKPHLHEVSDFLQQWVSTVVRAESMLIEGGLTTVTLHNNSGASDSSSSPALPSTVSYATYASHRALDLERMIEKILDEGNGLMTPEALCLFRTMHTAASQFPLLRSHHFKNWQIFTETFERTQVLKYREVDDRMVFAFPAPFQQQATVSTNPSDASHNNASQVSESERNKQDNHNHSVALAATAATSNSTAASDEEREILSRRLVKLMQELDECRRVMRLQRKEIEENKSAVVEANRCVDGLVAKVQTLETENRSMQSEVEEERRKNRQLSEELAAATKRNEEQEEEEGAEQERQPTANEAEVAEEEGETKETPTESEQQ